MTLPKTPDDRPSVVASAGRYLCWLFSLLLAGATLLTAQERFGNFLGNVTDPTGAAMPEVTVTLTNKENNRVLTTKTDASGAYLFRQVESGHYRFTFERTGFTRQEVPEALISVGQEIRVNVNMQVGGTEQTVQVTEAAPLIDTTTVLKASNISAEEFENLPKTRSFQSLAVLSPSVNSGTVEGGFQINGASGAENQFYIDGVTTTSLINGQSRENAAFEFLQEVQVKTGGIDAEYGGATGGVVSAITRSGGNAFHGEGHYYYYGNAISAGPVHRLLLLNQFDPTGNDPRYVQDHKNQDDWHEFGGSLGGYILKNKLFFFSSVSPQLRRRSNTYNFTGDTPDVINQNQTNQQLFNKVTYTPINQIRLNLSWMWTPTRVEGNLPAYTGEGNYLLTSRSSIQPNKNLGWTQPQNNYSGQFDWTVTPTSIVTVRGGRYWDNFRSWGLPPVSSVTFQVAPATAGITGLPNGLDAAQAQYSNTPRLSQSFYDIAARTYVQVDYSKYVGNFLGSHDLKLGVGTQKNVNKSDTGYPGNGYVFVYFGQGYPTNANKGQYGYYTVTNVGTRGSIGAHMTNMYIQDHWRIHPRVSITLGLRTENERVPSFNPSVVQDINFGYSQKLSPRVGLSWDVFGNGKLKGFLSYNRLYGWVPWETARGAFGGDFYTVYYRSLDTLDVLSLSGNNLPGRNLWPNGPYRDRRVPSPADPNLKPMTTDLANLGFEYQILPQTVLRVNWNRNHLVRTIEDMGALYNGDEVYALVNPGEGLGSVMESSGATPNNFPTPKAVRNYDALEVAVTRRFSKNFFASANYTYSRLWGNYSGTANSDEIQTPTTGSSSGTSQQFAGSIARAGVNASRAWDLDETVFNSHGQYLFGRLATDRPHVFKTFGNYSFPWGTEVGGFFLVQSGIPVSTKVETINTIPLIVNSRGDLGRTPVFNQTDLVIAHEIKFGEVKRLRFEFNAINVFNQKTTTHVFDQLNRGANTTSAAYALINLSKVNLYQGFDYKAMLGAIAATGQNPYDPRFGMGDLFNTGFQGRFGVKFLF